MDDSESSSN
ncbi:Protein of unknown function [Propionibacterium freudenreichii subsp. freudenreichii]|uniref:Uncharacterized protein n=1 Tax=Propionibacterium freudenreichii subsp. freudenreichii TaxID=66712 RepID=A0A0B7NU78_PROFF|nr:Protein of unknown function [Propionibacterium freudenreichii]CEP27485.1 Protein of unknown function [Propionibacterium freudenreichii subsp. freudenreichii]CEG95807.1 Protein of unknown function [Propionibacterium freudenreichii]CEH06166.1 Protein of unknown function [Propionibacterium freudenreichii]CEH07500.1 Protein of unknown function [Propionibacterium freudenreichii]